MRAVHPRHLRAQQLELAGAFDALERVRYLDTDLEQQRRELLGDWHRHNARPFDWLAAPELLEHGRDLKGRFAEFQATARPPRPVSSLAGERVTTGSKWIRFVTPGDARDLKAQIDASVKSTDGDVDRDTKLDDGVRSGWKSWRAGWASFMAHDAGWLDAAAQCDHAEAMQSELHDWQVKLEAKGTPLAGPVMDRPDKPETGAVLGVAKTALVVVGVVAAAVVVKEVASR